MYGEFARVYDLLYDSDDIPLKALALAGIIERRRRTQPAQTLLDVACGTGRFTRELARLYDVTGTDLSDEMLAVASERAPGVAFYRADMAELDPGATFDAVTCLGSSIGYMTTPERLHAAIRSMAKHLAPGGVLVIHPWLHPEAWVEGLLDAEFRDRPDLKFAMMSRSERRGNISVVDFHFMLLTADGIEHFHERHELAMYAPGEYIDAFMAAGLTVEHLPNTWSERGLFVGVRAG
jgi:SAM-dependent methyltransferase